MKKFNKVFLKSLILIVFMSAAYVLSMFLLVPLIYLLGSLGVVVDVDSTTGSLVLRLVVYVIAIIIFLLGFLWLTKGSWKAIWKIAGFNRLLEWKDMGLSVAGFIGYMILTFIVLSIATNIPGFDSSQAQDVGISTMFGMERFWVFLSLVVLAPVAEEFMFRGLLYGQLRKFGVWHWLSILIVSALFGLAHGQWNVGLDVFSLSVILCILREITGSIWSGIVLHMIKNFIAFFFLFVVGL